MLTINCANGLFQRLLLQPFKKSIEMVSARHSWLNPSQLQTLLQHQLCSYWLLNHLWQSAPALNRDKEGGNQSQTWGYYDCVSLILHRVVRQSNYQSWYLFCCQLFATTVITIKPKNYAKFTEQWDQWILNSFYVGTNNKDVNSLQGEQIKCALLAQTQTLESDRYFYFCHSRYRRRIRAELKSISWRDFLLKFVIFLWRGFPHFKQNL